MRINSSSGSSSKYEASPSSLPVASLFPTWRNQGTATLTEDAYGIYFDSDVDDELHIRETDIPAAPFSYYARIRHQTMSTAAVTLGFTAVAGFVLVNTTSGRIVDLRIGSDRISGDEQNVHFLRVARWTSPTVLSANVNTYYSLVPFSWLRVDVTSTGVTAFASTDGRRWLPAAAESFATFLTATGGTVDKLGIFAAAGANSTAHRAFFDVLQSTAP